MVMIPPFSVPLGKERKGSGRYASAVGNPPASAYNPVSGTFHMLETVVPDSGPSIPNGRYRSIDEIHDNNSVGASTEYDSYSNNGSYSGESDYQLQLAVASEIVAVLALRTCLADMHRQLGGIVIGASRDREPATVDVLE